MTKRQIDDADTRLIQLLQANAREPTASLARKIGLSRSAVQERLARLERDGVIAGYTLKPGRVPAPARFAALVLISLDARQSDRAVLALKAIPEVRSCATVSGEYDAVARVEADGAERLDGLLDEIGRLPGVRRTNSAILLAAKFER
jgi:DNA-binding Lrp family transcriptional regulator